MVPVTKTVRTSVSEPTSAGQAPSLITKQEQLSEKRVKVARLRCDPSKTRGEHAATQELSEVSEIIEGLLLAAQQELTEKMERVPE